MISMAGALVMVFILLVVIPVGVLMSGAIVAAVLGWVLRDDAEKRHEGSELIETNH
jgi:cytochrome b subunit of formate dehydrogenase